MLGLTWYAEEKLLTLMAAIEDLMVIIKILTHLGLPIRALPQASTNSCKRPNPSLTFGSTPDSTLHLLPIFLFHIPQWLPIP
ncbi:MAG: hypothetical protein GKS05_04585 [Nitrospirales bacterium]|nr:hypothetical protein [Nitrospirales bacterium]